MPKYTETQEDRLKKVIRDAIAIDPFVTVRSLQNITEKKAGRALSIEYIIKLKKKIRGEVAIRPDIERYESRLATLREKNRIVVEELFRIAFPDPNLPADQRPGIIDRRKALESISRIEKDMIKLEMDLGLFTRHLGQIDVEHRLKPLEDDARSNIIRAFQNWGVAPPEPRRIEANEAEVPKSILPPPIPHADTTAPTTEPSRTPQSIPTIQSGLVISQ